jgi:CubicO group peptidase (beta-lactamase class C family)
MTTGFTGRFILAAVLIAVSGNLPAADVTSLPKNREQSVDAFVGQFVDLAMFDGTLLIDIGGDVVYDKSFGYAHIELGVRHDEQTRFRIASVSKALTDAAIAVMIEQGKFRLDTPIGRYLPDFPSADRITIGQILNHTSGIPHTNEQPWGDGSISLTTDEIVERLAKLPLAFEPGSESRYSNGGYAVIAKIMEIAGGGTYSDVMHDTVFGPLAMKDTDHIDDSRAVIPQMATGYEPGLVPGERRHTRFYAVESRPGGGSLYSTVPDLLKFMRAVFREDFIPESLRRDVMGVDDSGYLSQGRSPGFVAKLLYEPDRDVIVISLANNYAVAAGWAAAIADLATGRVEQSRWPTLQRASLFVPPNDPRIGRYRSSFGEFELALGRSPEGYLLTIDDVNDAYAALIPLTDGSFLQPQYFQKCAQDSATRVITCKMLSGDERYTSTLTPVANE